MIPFFIEEMMATPNHESEEGVAEVVREGRLGVHWRAPGADGWRLLATMPAGDIVSALPLASDTLVTPALRSNSMTRPSMVVRRTRWGS